MLKFSRNFRTTNVTEMPLPLATRTPLGKFIALPRHCSWIFLGVALWWEMKGKERGGNGMMAGRGEKCGREGGLSTPSQNLDVPLH